MESETKTIYFTANEQIVDTALYSIQLPPGLGEEETVQAIREKGKRGWNFIQQFQPPVDPGDPHLESIEVLKDHKPTYKIVGVYIGADKPFPFEFTVTARGKRRALARAIDKAEGYAGEDLDTDPDGNLAAAAERAGMCIASLRWVGHEDNKLDDVVEFGREE